MALIKEKYSSDGINRIYQLLKNEAEKAVAKEYDIRVDTLKVVSRTNDPDRFFEHETFLVANSKNITINIYEGASPRCMKYMLTLTDEAPAAGELAGIEKTIQNRMQQERRGWEYDRQKKEIERLTEELTSNEKYTKQLEQEISRMQAEKQGMPGKLTQTLLSLAGAYITRNPEQLSGIPIVGQLFGGGSPGEQGAEQQIINDSDVRTEQMNDEVLGTYKKREEPKYTGEVAEEDFDKLKQALIPLLPEELCQKVADINKFLIINHVAVEQVHDLVMDAVNKSEQGQAA